MLNRHDYEVCFLTGRQQLYGSEAIEQVARHSQEIVQALTAAGTIMSCGENDIELAT